VAGLFAACGSTKSPQAALLPAPRVAQVQARRASAIDASVKIAKATYRAETRGRKLFQQLARIAGDGTLLDALARNDLAAARAEASAQLFGQANHLAHVTRISVVRGSRTLVNATINSDGVFVVAPASRMLHARGRLVGTLLVSLQDVTGFVKLVHRRTGAEVVVRGGSGHARMSLPAARYARLPTSGRVTIAEHTYRVRFFQETGWGGEPLSVWILERTE
jgi:hypothetical protein